MCTLGKSLVVHDVVVFPSLCVWCVYVLIGPTEDSTRKDKKANSKVPLGTAENNRERHQTTRKGTA